ncbi:uncharacterized protein TNCT_639371 [Trichonephila clavata]|uniref:Uncharacterized protein n=1 Tax=Trichonephila clavata TaxID=2740835 RepID=A0A8X6L7V8_TRICU|nr:uncharacterized protein TNCT_442081 [Trichonephila clavata]GFR24991.1 uncharacterized protein TNCT_639371 [Trichonephila clavata]
MKKIRKAIAKKFKNWKGSKIQEPSISSSADIEQQPTVVTAETTTAKDENSKEVCKYSVTNKDTTHAIDKATGTDTKLCESEDLQPICESNEEAQNDSTTVEPTSVDRGEANKQEPNSPSPAELYFDSKENSADEKSSKRAIQPIVAGVVGAALLVSSIVAYISKMYAIAVIVGIVGLACIGLALYNAIKPNTKLEKVEDIEQPIVESSLSLT